MVTLKTEIKREKGGRVVKLILLGEGGSEKTQRFLEANLSRRFSLTCCTGQRISVSGAGEELLLLASPELSCAQLEGGLFLARNGARLPKGLRLPGDAVVIVSSDEEEQLRQLARMGAQTVTCGLSCKDTVTFSSKSEDKAVVSLMREVVGLSGEMLEPMDIPITFSPESGDYPLLACTAALLLAGAITGEQQGSPTKYFQS